MIFVISKKGTKMNTIFKVHKTSSPSTRRIIRTISHFIHRLSLISHSIQFAVWNECEKLSQVTHEKTLSRKRKRRWSELGSLLVSLSFFVASCFLMMKMNLVKKQKCEECALRDFNLNSNIRMLFGFFLMDVI